MRRRRLGRTDVAVSELGHGAWGLASAEWVGGSAAGSLRALRESFAQGVTLVDTALAYGDGRSEQLVGEAVRATDEEIFVATKIPTGNGAWPARPDVPPDEMYSAEWIAACTERSLRNLGVETIDLQQLHTWTDDWIDHGGWADAVEQLRRQGKIRFFGVSINNHEPASALRLVESGLVDVVQVIYNLFDQSPADELLPAAAARDVGVIVRVPFDEGGLTGAIRPDSSFPAGDFRNAYFAGERRREVSERVDALVRDLGIAREQLPAAALRFCLSHPAVSTVIAGMRSPEHVRANAAAVAAGPLDAAELAAVASHRWVRDYYAGFYSD